MYIKRPITMEFEDNQYMQVSEFSRQYDVNRWRLYKRLLNKKISACKCDGMWYISLRPGNIINAVVDHRFKPSIGVYRNIFRRLYC